MFLREQSWRNSFALKRMEIDAGYEVRVKRCEYFYHKVHGVMVKWLCFWGLWGTLEIVKMWSWNILLFEEILHYAVLRSEWHGSVFLLTIRNLNYFKRKDFFISFMFLRKRSWRNSFAMKLCGNCIFSITKFSEMIVFWRALRNIGNCEDVKLKYFSLWRDSSLCCASFRMTRFCFLLTIRNLNYFWST